MSITFPEKKSMLLPPCSCKMTTMTTFNIGVRRLCTTQNTIDCMDMWHVHVYQSVAGAECVLFRGGGPTPSSGGKISNCGEKTSLRKKSCSGEKTQYILPLSPATTLQLSA